MSNNKSITTQTPPQNIELQPNVQFNIKNFDDLIYLKGYDVIWEKAIPCPCRVKSQGAKNPLSGCSNCGGIGWVYLNKVQTKMILSSMNLRTQFKEWSKELVGTVSITTRSIDHVYYMDKVTLLNGDSFFSEVLYPKLYQDTTLYVNTTYNIKSIEYISLFQGQDVKLKILKKDTDYTFQFNKIIFDDSYKTIENPSITVRYIHSPTFAVIDTPREVMSTIILDNTSYPSKKNSVSLPVHGIGRRFEFVFDIENYVGDRILDNSV